MKKFVLAVTLLFTICIFLTGCIHWETPVSYELMQNTSCIKSIQIYSPHDDSERFYDYSDPNDPCRVLLGEISSEYFTAFTEELTGLSFKEGHLILLLPVTYDPNFYYGNYFVKVEYHDGSCELISDIIQRQFKVNEKNYHITRYSTEYEAWLAFLQNWVNINELSNN